MSLSNKLDNAILKKHFHTSNNFFASSRVILDRMINENSSLKSSSHIQALLKRFSLLENSEHDLFKSIFGYDANTSQYFLSQKPETAIFLDDDEVILKSYQVLAKQIGINAVCFKSEIELLEQFEEFNQENNIIFIDENISTEKTGSDLARELFQIFVGKIFLLTGDRTITIENLNSVSGVLYKGDDEKLISLLQEGKNL